jgi:hypothetical protein
VSLAISEVEYLIKGLSDSPIPLLSNIKEVYVSALVCAKSFVCRCHAFFNAPRPMSHYDEKEDKLVACSMWSNAASR